MADTQKLVQRLFIEAAAACGDDPLAIERYVIAKLEELPADEQARFHGVAESVVAYKHDDKPPTASH